MLRMIGEISNRALLFVCAVAAWAACTDTAAVEETLVLAKIADGDRQGATAGNRLAQPFAVRVSYEGGLPAGDVRVVWEVTEGMDARLSSDETISDGQGQASVFLTLGPTVDTVFVRASLATDMDQAVLFTSYAVEPPVLERIEGDPFEGGDTLVMLGSGFSDSLTIFFNTIPAPVTRIAITGDTLWAVAPPCLETGPVDVRARVGSAVSAALVANHVGSTIAESLAVGAYVSFEATEAERCLLLGAADSSEYLAAVQALSLDGVAEDSFRITRGDTSLSATPFARSAPGPEEWFPSRFDAHLRASESRIAGRLERGGYRTEAPPTASPLPPEVGSVRTFRVCNKLDCEAQADFSVVEAEAKFVGDYVAVYVDEDTPTGGFSEQELRALGRMFDEDIFPNANLTFGAVSDLDRNGRVNVLMTPVVNSLTSPLGCLYGYVPGFFFPLDLDPAASQNLRSNQAEMLYLLVPDPEGAFGCAHSMEQVEEIIPVTFVHELQHAISFHQHVIVRGGAPEVVWLNEGLSHLAEDIAALRFRALGDELRASQFEVKNLANASNYLREPGYHSPVFTAGSGTGRERGAAWLLLRWVLDVYGVELARQLLETHRTGVDNLATATGIPVEHLLCEWFLANATTGVEGLITNHIRGYSSRDYREVFHQLHVLLPLQFPRSYPLEPTVLPANATKRGEIRSGSGEYYLVRDFGLNSGAQLSVASFTGAIAPNLAVRIHILRLR